MPLQTWLSPHIFDREILPPGYSIYRQDHGSKDGGVLVVVSDRIPSTQVHLQSSCELLVIHLPLHKDTFICCTYAPPSNPTSYFMDLAHCLYSLPTSSHLILLGDFNISDVNLSAVHARSSSSSSFCNLPFSLNLIQLVNVPTHSLGNTLDLVFSNHPDLISNLSVGPTCGNISDHYLITFHLSKAHTSCTASHPHFKWNY